MKLQRLSMIKEYMCLGGHVVFPHHRPIVTVELELNMMCRLCNGAVSEAQLISASCHSYRRCTVTHLLENPEIRHVKIRLSSGHVFGML